MESILERAMLWISRILILGPDQEGVELHYGCAYEIICVIDPCFKIGDRQVPCYHGCNIAAHTSFTDNIHSREKPHEAGKEMVICANSMGEF